MLGLVALGWAGMGLAFLRRPRHPQTSATTAPDRAARFGILLGAVGFALVWTFRRPETVGPFGLDGALAWAAVVLTAGLVLVALWLVWSAFRVLGAQWSAEARALERHELVTTGPYARVRHPIYAALGALLLTTGLAISRPWALVGGALLYGVGTAIRVRREEALLRRTFGETFIAYASAVPAFLPSPWSRPAPRNPPSRS